MLPPALIPAPVTTRVTGERVSLHDGLTIEATGELAGVGRWLRRALEQSLRWQVEISGHTHRLNRFRQRDTAPARRQTR